MPRAHRHYIPGLVWHITHRCHQRDFLLRSLEDRERWLHWLRTSKERYGIHILNYMATCNHIHLLVRDQGPERSIARSIQLTAGRTAQEHNRRTNRRGAFWEDRYHATAVESDLHLVRCIAYMDTNMVRAGVVKHPSEWPSSGYREIRDGKGADGLVDMEGLLELLDVPDVRTLRKAHEEWIEHYLDRDARRRQKRWTESVAVGRRSFVEAARAELKYRIKGRRVVEGDDGVCQLREPSAGYGASPGAEEGATDDNRCLWEIFPDI